MLTAIVGAVFSGVVGIGVFLFKRWIGAKPADPAAEAAHAELKAVADAPRDSDALATGMQQSGKFGGE